MNFDFFTAQPPSHIVKIVPEFLLQNGSDFWVSLISSLHDSLTDNDLPVSLAYTNSEKYLQLFVDIKALATDDTALGPALARALRDEMMNLEQVVFAESSTKKIYILPARRFNSDYLLNAPGKLLKNGVFERLDGIAMHDLAGACKCLLFGEATAAAFHVLRATEAVLKTYYFHHRKKNRLKKPMWADMVNQLQAKKSAKPPAALLKALDNIRQTYRNPTQHPESIYDLDRAQDLFGLCFDVIGQMGDEL